MADKKLSDLSDLGAGLADADLLYVVDTSDTADSLQGTSKRITAANLAAFTRQVVKGGTGLTTFAAGDLIYASAADTLARLAADANGKFLSLVSGLPSWQLVPTATTGVGTASATYTITASWGNSGLSVALPAGGTYLMIVAAELYAMTSAGYGAVDWRLYNATTSAVVAGTTRRAVAVTGYDRRTIEMSWVVTVADAATIRLEVIRVNLVPAPTWSATSLFGSVGGAGDMTMTYVRLS